jgi:hypothetical protein
LELRLELRAEAFRMSRLVGHSTAKSSAVACNNNRRRQSTAGRKCRATASDSNCWDRSSETGKSLESAWDNNYRHSMDKADGAIFRGKATNRRWAARPKKLCQTWQRSTCKTALRRARFGVE